MTIPSPEIKNKWIAETDNEDCTPICDYSTTFRNPKQIKTKPTEVAGALGYTSFDENSYQLPNEVPESKINLHYSVEVHADMCKLQVNSEIQNNNTNLQQLFPSKLISKTLRVPKKAIGMERTDAQYLNRIDVIESNDSIDDVEELSIQSNPPPSLQEKAEFDPITLHTNDIENLYKESKEHKSIVKGVMVNVFILCFMFLTAIIMRAFFPPTHSNMVILFMSVGATVKLYRTFGTIISAIYCFEVTNNLFRQILENTVSNTLNVFQRIGSIF